MTFTVEFPGLGLTFMLNRVAFSIGDFPVYWYGICIASGLLLGMLFLFSKAKRNGINDDRMVDVILLGAILAVACARIYYIVFAPFKYETLWQMLDLRDGGIAIYGAVIGAFVFGFVLCKWRKVPVLPMFDLTAIGFLIGQGIGRWGNFFNQEAFGTNTTMPWGMYSDGTRSYLAAMQQTLAAQGVMVDPSMPVHPTFFYESAWCLIGFLLLALYYNHRKFHGEIILLYLVWYGAERFVVEGLRTDSLMLGGVRMSQVVAGVTVVAALILWLILRIRHRGKPLLILCPVVDKRLSAPLMLTWEANSLTNKQVDVQVKKAIDDCIAEQEHAGEPKILRPEGELEPSETLAKALAVSEEIASDSLDDTCTHMAETADEKMPKSPMAAENPEAEKTGGEDGRVD